MPAGTPHVSLSLPEHLAWPRPVAPCFCLGVQDSNRATWFALGPPSGSTWPPVPKMKAALTGPACPVGSPAYSGHGPMSGADQARNPPRLCSRGSQPCGEDQEGARGPNTGEQRAQGGQTWRSPKRQTGNRQAEAGECPPAPSHQQPFLTHWPLSALLPNAAAISPTGLWTPTVFHSLWAPWCSATGLSRRDTCTVTQSATGQHPGRGGPLPRSALGADGGIGPGHHLRETSSGQPAAAPQDGFSQGSSPPVSQTPTGYRYEAVASGDFNHPGQQPRLQPESHVCTRSPPVLQESR